MYLQTNLRELKTAQELKDYINENENVMVCCGRMGPMCIPVYDVMEEMVEEEEYAHVKFAVMGFDNPEASVIRNAPECRNFMGLPFTMYYRNGEVAAATSSIQSREQIADILSSEFVMQS
jgi:thioredoxin 1